MQCQASKKRTGEQCWRRAVAGKRVCTVHGGLTPGGTASVHFKTGRYSRSLPPRLREQYEAAAQDERLLELREDIALLDARIAQLLERVDQGEPGALWRQAQAVMAAVTQAEWRLDVKGMQAYLAELRQVVGRGAADYAAWEEIGTAIQARRRLVESERKRLIEMQQMLSYEQAMVLTTALADIVKRMFLIRSNGVPLLRTSRDSRLANRSEGIL